MRARPRTRALLGVVAGATVTALFSSTYAPSAVGDTVERGSKALTSRQVADPKAKSIPDKWLVQVAGSPLLRGGSMATAKARQNTVRQAAANAGVSMKVLNSYTRVWNGFSVEASQSDVNKLRGLAGVTKIYPVYAVELPRTTVKPDLSYSVPMIGADAAQVEGYTGAGIKVGVIDTGIDYNHPDLGGSGVEGSTADFGAAAPRVKYGYDFVGDAYDADKEGSEPVPDPYPDDCNGHGTHVAGIIGANGDSAAGGVVGVAPEVTFGAYRVFSCDGSADTEVILAAMDRAAADGMDVVNMSLGESFASWPDYPDAAAADALRRAGTIVVAAAGNDGLDGLFSAGSPGVGKSVISVASVENTDITLRYFTVDPVPDVLPDGSIGYLDAEGAPAHNPGDTASLAVGYSEDGFHTNTYGCDAFADLTGKTVLIKRGGTTEDTSCTFYEKAYNAQAAGAAGVVIYNNTTGIISPTVKPASTEEPSIDIPVVFVAQRDGQALANAVPTQTTTATWTDSTESVANPEAGAISDFSSFGPAADLSDTPDVAAPGGNIWSTYPLELGGHASLSGTSMATPHVTGSVALLLEATAKKLKGNVDAVRAALQNTSTPVDKLYAYGYQVIDGVYEPTVRQGSGLINVEKAISAATSGTTVTPGQINLGDNRTSFTKTQLKLTNTGTTTEKYTLGVVNAANVGAAPTTYWYDYDVKKATSKFSSKTVTVKAGKTATVTVSLKQPKLAAGWLYGGWITLTKSDKSKTLVVPFTGMAGDYQKVKVLQGIWDVNSDQTALEEVYDLPALAESAELGTIIEPADAKPSFDLSDSDHMPYVLFHFDYPVADAYLNVFRATSSGKKGAEVFSGYKTFLETGELGRDDSYYAVAFDGKIPFNASTSAGLTVPDGDYVIELRVLKAGGNTKKSTDWETWTSPAFAIQRAHG
ncbi:MAG: S8 family serine peptidase [Propionicimonas sp.]|uniref:S8 family serine peptidase n=1 Tax=Propionicimonas sp. TaxID=1955623 RepID=UPI003D0D8AB4